MRTSRKTLIADLLLKKQLITPKQLEIALEHQAKTDKKIGEILVELGFIDQDILLQLVSEQLHISYVDLKSYALDQDTVKLLPEFTSRNLRAIVLKSDSQGTLVGMVDPQDLLAKDEIEHILKRKIKLALIREEDLLWALDSIYRHTEKITHFAETLSAELKPTEVNLLAETQDFTSEDMPVVNLLRSIFENAAEENASDIHIEPDEKVLRIRVRVDGVLQEQIIPEKTIATALIQRIKIISGLNIAEKRLPQDGRFTITVRKKKFDVRVSTIPVQYGESLVMRLLNQSAELLQLKQIGMPQEIYHYFHRLLFASYGLLLIVGPTGSGKTTTLYASLNELNSAEDKIITVEDPVEYHLPRINQVQVAPKIDLTFATLLRSILRQDPDIIMIGELRDQETVEIALRAAMTGHLVLATLHTNDTISAVTRLLDMDAEGYIAASVLRGILAQRLVRKICPQCKVPDPLNDNERAWLATIPQFQQKNINFYQGEGCANCHHTGYRGRIGVFELLPMTFDLANILRKEDTVAFYAEAVKQSVYKPLVIAGLEFAAQGLTTVREIINMAGQI